LDLPTILTEIDIYDINTKWLWNNWIWYLCRKRTCD
jgi:hypothetical protein